MLSSLQHTSSIIIRHIYPTFVYLGHKYTKYTKHNKPYVLGIQLEEQFNRGFKINFLQRRLNAANSTVNFSETEGLAVVSLSHIINMAI